MAPTSATSPTAGETRASATGTEGTGSDAPVLSKDEQEAKAQAAPEADEQPAPGTVVVEFVGVPPYGREFHRERAISKADFTRVGVDHKALSFNEDNGFRQEVPADNEALLEYFRSKDDGFKVHEDA